MDPLACDCQSCNALGTVRAIDLIDRANVSALLELAQDPRRLFRDEEDCIGLYLASWYKSTHPAPCIFKCFAGALNQIIFIRIARLERQDSTGLRSWMAWIRDDISHDLPASLYSELLARRGQKTVEGMLNVALAYWIEAAQAHDAGHVQRAWPALAQSHLYVGLGVGPLYASESSSRGGKQRASNYGPITEEALRVLGSIPDRHFPHISDAKDYLAGKLKSFGFENPKHRTNNPRAFLDSYCKKTGPENTQVVCELERVSVRLKGRPPKGQTVPPIDMAGATKPAPPTE